MEGAGAEEMEVVDTVAVMAVVVKEVTSEAAKEAEEMVVVRVVVKGEEVKQLRV